MTIDLEALQKQKAEELLAERTSSEEVITAFLVVQGLDGQWVAHSNFADKDLSMQRTATLDDLIGGCANVTAGCQMQQTAISTVIMMEQRAAQMQYQIAQQQEAQRVSSLIDPKKLRV
jgi:hypothetical protein